MHDSNAQAVSWNVRERDKAAGLACSRGEAPPIPIPFFSSILGCKALNRPSLLMELYLIPNVDHIELFAASSGSSILSVFGTTIELSELLGFRSSPLLECFPRGELGLEEAAAAAAGDGIGSHGTFQRGVA